MLECFSVWPLYQLPEAPPPDDEPPPNEDEEDDEDEEELTFGIITVLI